MGSIVTNDGCTIAYRNSGLDDVVVAKEQKPWLILIHGFTGSSLYWQHNIPALSQKYRCIAPDLRGHGDSDKPKHGFHVSRLAMDLRELISVLAGETEDGLKDFRCSAIGGSLGCSVLWCYSELFGTNNFTNMVFVDQSPLQNSTLDGWDERYCNSGMNSPSALLSLQHTLATKPDEAYRATISACLSYSSHPDPSSQPTPEQIQKDTTFFLGQAQKGSPIWFGKLMADHTALDWRTSIAANFGPRSGGQTKILVVASSRSGCFPAAGPMRVVEYVNGGDDGEGGRDNAAYQIEEKKKRRARGVVVDWGGHWCFWEQPEKFNNLVLDFLTEDEDAVVQ